MLTRASAILLLNILFFKTIFGGFQRFQTHEILIVLTEKFARRGAQHGVLARVALICITLT